MVTLAAPIAFVKPTPTDRAIGSRLTYLADGGDPDRFRPDWWVADLDIHTGKTYLLHAADAGFFPEANILDTEAASYAAFPDQEAEDAHFDDLADESLAYSSMMPKRVTDRPRRPPPVLGGGPNSNHGDDLRGWLPGLDRQELPQC